MRLHHPEYFTVIVPLARLTYDTFNADWSTVLSKPVLVIAVIAFILWQDKRGDRVGGRIVALCIGSAASYIVQFKGWAYHLLPLEGYTVLFSLWLCANARADRSAFKSCAIVAVAVAAIAQVVLRGPYDSEPSRILKPLAQNGPANPRTLMLSSRVMMAFPLVNDLGGTWASRYPHQWFLTGAIRKLGSDPCIRRPADCDEYRAAVQYALETNVEDILKNKPQLVYVDRMRTKAYFGGVPFDYVDFL